MAAAQLSSLHLTILYISVTHTHTHSVSLSPLSQAMQNLYTAYSHFHDILISFEGSTKRISISLLAILLVFNRIFDYFIIFMNSINVDVDFTSRVGERKNEERIMLPYDQIHFVTFCTVMYSAISHSEKN